MEHPPRCARTRHPLPTRTAPAAALTTTRSCSALLLAAAACATPRAKPPPPPIAPGSARPLPLPHPAWRRQPWKEGSGAPCATRRPPLAHAHCQSFRAYCQQERHERWCSVFGRTEMMPHVNLYCWSLEYSCSLNETISRLQVCLNQHSAIDGGQWPAVYCSQQPSSPVRLPTYTRSCGHRSRASLNLGAHARAALR